MQEATNTTPCMRPDPEDLKVTCALPHAHNVRRRPCSWQKRSRPPSRPELGELSPAEPQLTAASRLSPRGGRSEHGCGLSSMPGRPIEELIPRAQAFAASRTREVLRLLDIEADLAPLRPRAIEPAAFAPTVSRTVRTTRAVTDQCTERLFDVLESDPRISARAFFLQFDQSIHRERNENKVKAWQPPESWMQATGKRAWADLHKHRVTKKRVQAWFDRRRADWRRRKEAATKLLR